MAEYFDMHCHPGFLPEGGEGSALAGLSGALNCTVTPAEFAASRGRFAAFPQVRTAIGLHPWYVDADAEGARVQADAVCDALIPGCAVGEVGLDFGPRHASTRDLQTEAFRRIAQVAAARGGCLMSIHSVQATETVLNILDACGFFAGGTVIFHWYSGSSDHLARALRVGARFSANPRMLDTRKGREYLRIIPEGRLLTETDLPAEDGTCPVPMAAELARLIAGMARIRGVEAEALAAALAAQAGALLASISPEWRHS